MAIRKYGAARDQEVTAVEQDGISKQAAGEDWDHHDDRELAEENRGDGRRTHRVPLDNA